MSSWLEVEVFYFISLLTFFQVFSLIVQISYTLTGLVWEDLDKNFKKEYWKLS